MYQWVKRYVEPSSIVGGILINAMRGTYDSYDSQK
ncbi:transposase [Bacillus haynesii]|nr:transposase [Bacillus haynesii]